MRKQRRERDRPGSHVVDLDTHGGARPLETGEVLRGIARIVPDFPTILDGLLRVRLSRPAHRISLAREFQRTAAKHPERPFLRFRGGGEQYTDLTYAEANMRANRMAEVLRRTGVGRGDVVAVLTTNRPETVLAVLATAKLGATAGLLNHHQRGDVLAHSFGLLDPAATLVGPECAEALASLPEVTPLGRVLGVDSPTALAVEGLDAGDRTPLPAGTTWLDDEVATLGSRAGATNPEGSEDTRGHERALLIFTSGTTGMPKASAMSNLRWVRALNGIGRCGVRLGSDDVMLCALPLYHNNALTVALGSVIAGGACLAIEERFSASRFWDQARESGATAFVYIGEFCRYLLGREPGPGDRDHSVRLMLGNGLRPEIWDEFTTRFGVRKVREFYAASECNLVFVNVFDMARTAGYCPLPYKIVEYDEETGGPRRGPDGRVTEVGVGGVGLLLTQISPSQPFDGYTDAAETEKKIARDAVTDGDAWFVTGDLMLDQGHEHVSFVDRLGDTFRWKGENVATSEVEGVLDRTEDIAQAAVYGVALPGADGKAGMAAIRLAEGSKFDGRALADFLAQHLPSYAVPQFVRVVDELAQTSTFKSQKADLKKQGVDRAQFDDPLYVLSRDGGYVDAYDGCAEAVVAGTA